MSLLRLKKNRNNCKDVSMIHIKNEQTLMRLTALKRLKK